MQHNLKFILAFVLIAVLAQGCAYAPTAAQNRIVLYNEIMDQSVAELEQCILAIDVQHPGLSLKNVLWDGDYNTTPISYLTNKQYLDETQKAELTASADATSLCNAQFGQRMLEVDLRMKSLVDTYTDQERNIVIALLQDRINIGEYHEALKQLAFVTAEAINTTKQQINAELAGQHRGELAQRQAAYERFQRGILNASAIINAGTPRYDTPTSRSSGSSMTGYLSSQEVSGFNRICYYRVGLSHKALTIGATELCPLSY